MSGARQRVREQRCGVGRPGRHTTARITHARKRREGPHLVESMRKGVLIGSLSLALLASAQVDSSLFIATPSTDTSRQGKLNMDAVYDRPFLTFDKVPVSLGGYVETKVEHLGTNGLSE